MNYPDFIAPEMRELLDALDKALVPRSKRKEFVKTNWHTPHYSRGRTTRF